MPRYRPQRVDPPDQRATRVVAKDVVRVTLGGAAVHRCDNALFSEGFIAAAVRLRREKFFRSPEKLGQREKQNLKSQSRPSGEIFLSGGKWELPWARSEAHCAAKSCENPAFLPCDRNAASMPDHRQCSHKTIGQCQYPLCRSDGTSRVRNTLLLVR